MITNSDRELAARFLPALKPNVLADKKKLDATARSIAEHCLPERKALMDLVSQFQTMQRHESWKPVWKAAADQGVLYTGPTMEAAMKAAKELIATYPTPDPMGETDEA